MLPASGASARACGGCRAWSILNRPNGAAIDCDAQLGGRQAGMEQRTHTCGMKASGPTCRVFGTYVSGFEPASARPNYQPKAPINLCTITGTWPASAPCIASIIMGAGYKRNHKAGRSEAAAEQSVRHVLLGPLPRELQEP